MSDGDTPLSPKGFLAAPLKTIGAGDLLALGCKHSGFLRKRQKLERILQAFSLNSMKWRQKFIILSQGCVYCYGSEYSNRATQAFSLAIYEKVQRYEDSTMKFCFEVVPEDTRQPSHVFACESDQKRLEWMEYLHEMLRLTHGHSDGRRKSPEYEQVEIGMHNLMTDAYGSGGSLKGKRVSLPPLPRLPCNDDTEVSLPSSSKRSNFAPVPLPISIESEYDLESDHEDDGTSDDTYDDIDLGKDKISTPKHSSSPSMKVQLPGMGGAPRPAVPKKPILVDIQEDYYNDITQGEYLFASSNREAVQAKLRTLPVGYFLVRDSSKTPGGKVLSVVTEDGVKEYSVIKGENNEVSLNKSDKFLSLHEMIVHYMTSSLPVRDLKLKRGYKLMDH